MKKEIKQNITGIPDCPMDETEQSERYESDNKKPDNSYPLMQQNGCEKSNWCKLPENHLGKCSNALCGKCGKDFTYHSCPKLTQLKS